MKRSLVALLVLALVWSVSLIAIAAVKTGDAPRLTVRTLKGGELSLEQLRGRVVLIDFWATWCTPCERSLPFYAELETRFSERGLTVIAVSVDENAKAVGAFLSENPMPFAVAIDENHGIVGQFEPPVMPTAYLIDKKGVVRHIHAGFRRRDQKAFSREIEKLLVE